MRISIPLILLCLCSAAFAGTPTLSVEKTQVYVTQKVVITLAVKPDSIGLSNLQVDTGDNRDIIMVVPNLTEDNSITNQFGMVIRGPTYQFVIYPQKAGALRVGSFALSYELPGGLGEPSKTVHFKTNALTLDVQAPKGAPEGAFVLVTPDLTVKTHYEPDVSRVSVGHAIERTIEIRAVNVPDVLIPAVKTKAPPGFNIYPGEPVLKETPSSTDANVTYAFRTQKDTFVAVSGGETEIPGQAIYWFDGSKLHKVSVAARKVGVAGAAKARESAGGGSFTRVVVILMLAGAGVFAAVLVYRRWGRRYLADRKTRYEQSERGRFEQLKSGVRTGDPIAIYRDFYSWADLAIADMNERTFVAIAARYPEAGAPLAILDHSIQGKADFDGTRFLAGMEKLRNAAIRNRHRHQFNLPVSLNPV